MMREAVRQRYRIDNPCTGIKRHVEHSRMVDVTRAQLDQLYAALEAHPNREAVNAIKLLVWTGARKGEVLNARWAEFDLERGSWTRPPWRTKQKRISEIPLNPRALKLLVEMRAANPASDLLFPSPVADGRARADVKKIWAAIRKATGFKTLRMHDLRRVFATAALEGGVPLDAIAPLLGHSSTVMTRTYAHWRDKLLRDATGKAAAQLAQPPAPETANGRLHQ
jgi:integrase